MGFDFKTGSLRDYAYVVNDLGWRIDPQAYVRKHTEIEWYNEGLLTVMRPVHASVVQTVERNLDKIYGYDALLYRSAKALEDTENLYTEVDGKGSDRFKDLAAADTSIGQASRPTAVKALPPIETNTPYGMPHDPLQGDAGRLLSGAPYTPRPSVDKNPEGEDPDDPLVYLESAVEWLSPTHIINRLIRATVGIDIVAEVSQAFQGDWRAWRACADVWHRVGGTHALVAHELWRGNARLDPDWNGNAADKAYAHFHQIATTLRGLQSPYEKLAGAYRTVAIYVDKAANLVADGLKDLGDLGIIALLSMTPVGSAVLSANIVKRMGQLVTQIQTTIKIYKGILTGAAGTLATINLAMTDLEKKLPQPYAMPAAYRNV